ncbi:hypothetical protein SNEBB_004158 [Seison nebaliae]|nr:hypothetical protein SNEBB_004158 [Seison nebaliae]
MSNEKNGSDYVDKNSEEYKWRRAKNNESVRKCREKEKMEEMETRAEIMNLEERNVQLESEYLERQKEMRKIEKLIDMYTTMPEHQLEEEQTKFQSSTNHVFF